MRNDPLDETLFEHRAAATLTCQRITSLVHNHERSPELGSS